VPDAFARDVYSILEPGTTVVVTDRAVTEQTMTDPGFVILTHEVAEVLEEEDQ
jgi:hypothetical protein